MDKSLRLALVSLKAWGLLPPPLSQLFERSQRKLILPMPAMRKTLTKFQCCYALVGIVYSLFLLVLSWLNVFRFLTLFVVAEDTLIGTDVAYATSICLYYFTGACLRTVLVVGSLMGGNYWKKLTRSLEDNEQQLVTILYGEDGYLTGRKRARIWVVTFIVFSWVLLTLSVSSLTALMMLYRDHFRLFATPFHQPSIAKQFNWPLTVFFFGVILQSINDSAIYLGTMFISSLAVVEGDHFSMLNDIVPDIEIDHHYSTIAVSEANGTQTQITITTVKKMYEKIKQCVLRTDRLARFGIVATMLEGLFGCLILSHHIVLEEVELFGRPTWFIWLAISFYLLLILPISSAFLNAKVSFEAILNY